jgi:hypothetical protein
MYSRQARTRDQDIALENDFHNAAAENAPEGVSVEPPDEFDVVFGDGNDLMNIDLPSDSALSDKEATLMATLNEKLAAIKYESCDYCLEDAFGLNVVDGMCASCRQDTGGPVRKWSAENGVHPGIYPFPSNKRLLAELSFLLATDVPLSLRGLTDMEEMLIARVKCCMQVRWTKGRQLCYQDHIINFRQDVTEVATKLPRLPEETDIVIIRKEGVDMSQHIDFIVRRAKVKAALEYKIAKDPDFADLIIDSEALDQLPENGTVVDRLPICREGRQGEGPAMPEGPDGTTGEEGHDDDESFVGGVVDLANQERPEVEQIRERAATATGIRYEQTIVSTVSFEFS